MPIERDRFFDTSTSRSPLRGDPGPLPHGIEPDFSIPSGKSTQERRQRKKTIALRITTLVALLVAAITGYAAAHHNKAAAVPVDPPPAPHGPLIP